MKRLTNTTFLDGRSIARTYADCCNAGTETDREGTVTSYTHDGLKRVLTTTKNSITVSNVYDAHGNITRVWRYPTSGSPITLSTATWDNAGRLTRTQNALAVSTTYTNYLDGSGQVLKQTTYPTGGGARMETYYKDGALLSVTGTAVHGISYDYGVESEGGTQRFYTKETKVTEGGTNSLEWIKTYSDFAARPYKVVFPDGAASQTFYNTAGQVSKTVDPDGVTTLFQYNSLGELD